MIFRLPQDKYKGEKMNNLDFAHLIIKVAGKTINELVITFIEVIDFALPDLTIFSVIRPFIFFLTAKIGTGTRIKRGLRITNINRLKIGGDCYINKNNFFHFQSQ